MAEPTRFELELEFVSMLASPAYLIYLASTKTLQQPTFVAYLEYLQYWAKEPYIQYLSYPGPTLRALELLQSEDFRKDVLRPEVGAKLIEAMLEGAKRR
jgi:mediator of RNA polymerase II transcription subunit 31